MSSKFLLFYLFTSAVWAQNKDWIAPVLNKEFKSLNVRDFAIDFYKKEAYLTIHSPNEEISAIFKVRQKSGKWGKPKMAPFSGKYRDLEPFLSLDGKRLYFASNRPWNKNNTESKDFDIWYVERENTKEEWGEPVNLGAPVNSEADEFFPSLSANNNLYFTSDRDGSVGKDDIFMAKWDIEHYEEPKALGDEINSENYEFNAFISPDESYLIFTGYSRPDGQGSGDLYISWKKDDIWQKAQNLGKEINSKSMDYCPFVDSKGNLYFTSKRSEIEKDKKYNTSSFLKEITKYQNGVSKIYLANLSD